MIVFFYCFTSCPDFSLNETSLHANKKHMLGSELRALRGESSLQCQRLLGPLCASLDKIMLTVNRWTLKFKYTPDHPHTADLGLLCHNNFLNNKHFSFNVLSSFLIKF